MYHTTIGNIIYNLNNHLVIFDRDLHGYYNDIFYSFQNSLKNYILHLLYEIYYFYLRYQESNIKTILILFFSFFLKLNTTEIKVASVA